MLTVLDEDMFSDGFVKPAGLQSRILFFFVRAMAQVVKKRILSHDFINVVPLND